MRRMILRWLARLFDVPVYFEVIPIETAEWDHLDFSMVGVPVVYNGGLMEKAVWPKPMRTYRLFIQV